MSTVKDLIAARTDEGKRPARDLKRSFAALLRKIWWSMSVMKEDFEQRNHGSRSHARGAERLRDEERWTRSYDEGGAVNGPIRVTIRSACETKPLQRSGEKYGASIENLAV